jgi:hypothetical protein
MLQSVYGGLGFELFRSTYLSAAAPFRARRHDKIHADLKEENLMLTSQASELL